MTLRPYVTNFINTLSKRQNERVSNLLQEAHVGKDDIERIAERLENIDEFSPTELDQHAPLGRINRSTVKSNTQEISADINELYEVVNLISLLLNSQSEELSSKVEAIEREIDSMEKLTDLYSFMLADNQRYDSSYMETFHDERGRSEMVEVPDRAGHPFGPHTFGDVRVDEGVFCISDKAPSSYPLAASVISTNAANFGDNESRLSSMLVDSRSQGWKFNIAAPHRISAPMNEDPWRHAGAQALLEFRLPDSFPATEITLVPNTDTPAEEVLSIRIYENIDHNDWRQVVDRPFKLERMKSFHFPPQPVARFQVVLNQPVYDKRVYASTHKEDTYRRIIRQLIEERKLKGPLNEPPYRFDELLREVQTEGKFGGHDDSQLDDIALDVLYHIDPQTWEESFDGVEHLSMLPVEVEDDSLPSPRLIDPAYNRFQPPEHQYHYTIGLKNAAISIEGLNHKAVFVTRAIPAEGDMGVVRLKADYENQFVSGTDRDSQQISSVEFSVSNQSEPELESDWVPILPVGEDRVMGERLFPNKDGVAHLRFNADPNSTIHVYRQGYEIDDRVVNLRYDGPWIGSLELEIGTIAQEDVFTCDYYPARDHTTIDFDGRGFEKPALAFAHSDNGPGERFLRTADSNRVKLANYPYTNVRADADEPIVVQLNSGEIAINKTGGALHPDDPLSFVQSGRDIVFNKAITEPFRIYYHYLENNVRIRAVLRGNGKEFATPELKSFKLKGKMRHSSPRSDR